MSITRSRDCIHSSCSGHSSSLSRNRDDCPFHRCWKPLAALGIAGWRLSLPRTTRSAAWCSHGGSTAVTGVYRGSAWRAVRLDLVGVRDIALCTVWPLGRQSGLPLRPGELHVSFRYAWVNLPGSPPSQTSAIYYDSIYNRPSNL